MHRSSALQASFFIALLGLLVSGFWMQNARAVDTAPAITSALSAKGNVGSPFTYTITATGTPAPTFTATPLPAGLTLSGAIISGTPAAIGTFVVAMNATNSAGGNTKDLVILIEKPKGAGVGAALQITNPFLVYDPAFPGGGKVGDPQGFDLGDVLAGTPFTRYISVSGGFMPYTFTLQPLLDPTNTEGGVPPGLPEVSTYGKVSGVPLGQKAMRFIVEINDPITTRMSEPVRGIFRMTVSEDTIFRFAHDSLPKATQMLSYYTKIETIGGEDVTVSLVPESKIFIGPDTTRQEVSRLEDAGLVLAPDGTLYGRPLKPGNITFTARANVPINTTPATDRGINKDNQQFTLQVENNKIVSSELTATLCSLQGDRTTGRTALSYSGFIDMKGQSAASLAGTPFVLRIGTARFSGTLNEKGKIDTYLNAAGNSIPTPTDPIELAASARFTVSLSPASSRIQIKLLNAALARQVGIDKDTTGSFMHTVVLAVETGGLHTSEVLRMESSSLTEGTYRLDYALGKQGYSKAGGFQILTVKGSDSTINSLLDGKKVKNPGIRWRAQFLAVPPQENDGTAAPFATPTASEELRATSLVSVRVGQNFVQAIGVAPKKSTSEFKAARGELGISRLTLSHLSMIHRVDIQTIPIEDSLPQAASTKERTVFPFGIEFGNAFKGDTGRLIVPSKASWKQH